jgi:hypothetical protein
LNPDFRDLLAAFNAEGVDYLVVGAHALAVHGFVRATKDLDIWVRPSSENAARVIRALSSFGAPLQDLTENDLSRPDTVFQIGLPPVRVDVMTAIDGVEFADAWEDRVKTRFSGEPANVLSFEDLLQNKRTAGRLQDLADIEGLEKVVREPEQGGGSSPS